jgi:hypothetical protein
MEKAIKELPVPPFRDRLKSKAWKWIKRFLPAEVIGTLVAIACGYVASALTRNRVTIAYAASMCETAGFYLTIIVTDALVIRKQLKIQHRTLTLPALLLVTVKNMVLDFGLAELADSFLVRPLFMYLFPLWLKDYPSGIVAGKIASDVVFYVPVIIAAEVRLYFSRKRAQK